MLVDLLIVLLIVIAVPLAVTVGVALWFSMPLADVINRGLRRLGLAGPSRETRAPGVHQIGVVDEPFRLAPDAERATGRIFAHGELWNATCRPDLAGRLEPGDEVEFVYQTRLTVTVVRRLGRG